MPAVPLLFRPICGGFTFVFLGFMFRRIKVKRENYQRTLKVGNYSGGVVVGLLLTTFFFGILLRRAGDVESNPGPKDSMRQTRLTSGTSGRNTSLDSPGAADQSSKQQVSDSGSGSTPTLLDIMTLLTGMNTKFDNMQQEFHEIREEYTGLIEEIKELKEEITRLKEDNEELKRANDDYKSKITGLELKTDDLEGRSKRNNLVFFGLPRQSNETPEDCEKIVGNLVKEKLEISSDIQFDRVHRLNRKDDSPVVARCTFYKQKMEVLKAKQKLKGSKIFIGEDFSQRVRDVRKKLSIHLRQAKSQNKRVKMVYDHLVIEGKKFGLDKDENLIEFK